VQTVAIRGLKLCHSKAMKQLENDRLFQKVGRNDIPSYFLETALIFIGIACSISRHTGGK
jgi:hypothetical protein